MTSSFPVCVDGSDAAMQALLWIASTLLSRPSDELHIATVNEMPAVLRHYASNIYCALAPAHVQHSGLAGLELALRAIRCGPERSLNLQFAVANVNLILGCFCRVTCNLGTLQKQHIQ